MGEFYRFLQDDLRVYDGLKLNAIIGGWPAVPDLAQPGKCLELPN